MSEHMETMIDIMYNDWKCITKEEIAKYVIKKALTSEEYKQIVGEDYIAPK